MQELAVFQTSFDKNAYGAAIVNRWFYFAQPDVLLIAIPTAHLGGQCFCTAIGIAFRCQCR